MARTVSGSTPVTHQVVMAIEKGEELIGGWVTPHIPTVGVYKLLAKRKVDGKIAWVHFVQRDSGLKEGLLGSTVDGPDELSLVHQAINNNLRKLFGTALQAADYDVQTLNGKKASDTRQ